MNTSQDCPLFRAAQKIAIDHVNYLKFRNPHGFNFRQAEEAVERFTRNRLEYWSRHPEKAPVFQTTN